MTKIQRLIKGTIILLVLFSLSGCGYYIFKRDVNLDELKKEMSTINYSDGIDDLEAKSISQYYLMTTNEEPCKSLAKIYDVGTPYRKLVKNETANTEHYYMGFLKYGWFVLKPDAPWLRLLIDTKTGKVTCIGEIHLKSEPVYTVQ